MVTPTPREVNVEIVPADGYELEIEGALSIPFVSSEDVDKHHDAVVAECVRAELFIPDDVPLVLVITDPDGELRRVEQPPSR